MAYTGDALGRGCRPGDPLRPSGGGANGVAALRTGYRHDPAVAAEGRVTPDHRRTRVAVRTADRSLGPDPTQAVRLPRAVQATYSHVTPAMRRALLDGLTGLWEASLDARRALDPGSPVAVLDRLLRQRAGEAGR